MAAQRRAKTREVRAREGESGVGEAKTTTEAVTDLRRIAGIEQEPRGMCPADQVPDVRITGHVQRDGFGEEPREAARGNVISRVRHDQQR